MPNTERSLRYRWVLVLLVEAILITLTYCVSFLLAYDFVLRPNADWLFIRTLPIALVLKLVIFYFLGLLVGWWRYSGMSDLFAIGKATCISSAAFFLVVLITHLNLPKSIFLIDMALTLLVMGGARFTVRAYSEYVSRQFSSAAAKRTLVVGAGRAGISIVRELKLNTDLDYDPVGFVDDDISKSGVKIHGLKVFGTTKDLENLIRHHKIERVLIAIPSASGSLVERIISKCRVLDLDIKILPRANERMNGARVREVRNVRMEDLLGRDSVRLDTTNIRRKLEGKVLLITGAAGSIGSELIRQAAAFEPKRVVLFERSENDLFRLSNELATTQPNLNVTPIIGDILDVSTLRDVFAQWRPHSVFHAAAYKHVPIMELNCFQAVINNVLGTYNVALVARQFEAEDFVMISSDKAVNPTNIMGATKRIAELIILGLQHHRTRYVAVRFGNVLGSNGSVLPTFQQQIARGGPITVTHPDAMRYFMTIPEAAQLVLQASTMGRGGEIFILDMGEPVKIVDFARNLIRLSGFTPDKDMTIAFTGLRPGEKLHEELIISGEGIKPTTHPKIRVLDGGNVSFAQVRRWLDELSNMVEAKDVHGLITTLKAIIPEYTISPEIEMLCQLDRHDRSWRYQRRHIGWHGPLGIESGSASARAAGED
jgi:FlaA1/EpsC-like NDP-sugar epimerase